jgi:hypothetical protein
MKDFICPECGKKIEISEALTHQISENIKIELEQKIKKELQDSSSIEIQDLKKQLQEKNQKVDEYKEQELKLREEKRKLDEEKKDNDIKVQRMIDEERKKIEEKVQKESDDEHRLKEKEKDQMIDGLKKALDEMRRKANVGSQQLQGEVLELDLEDALRREFPNDQIEPVEKGVKGADIRQIVKSPKGIICGVILWETKRAKAWSDSWITKLKSDLRAEGANIPVIITNIMPKDIPGGMGQRDGVIVVGFNLYLPLAYLLRKNLLDVGFQIAKTIHSGEKKDYLFEFITSHEFLQQVEAMVEVYREMKSQVRKEREAYERIWKMRESQADRLMSSTINIVGGIQGKIGQAALQVKGLDLLESGGDFKEDEM